MSSISDSSDNSSESDCLLSDFEFELEDEEFTTCETTRTASPLPIVDDVDEGAYQDEPIASNEWIDDYKQKEKEKREQEEELTSG